jgi:oxygen-dependent protoporphyrinogen oxidase
MPEAAAPTVVVVGAGISGLTAAHELLRLRPDVRVVVLDGADRVGGKLALLEVGGFTVDAGAEALLARRPEAVDLARAVGLGADLVSPRTTSAGVWSRGRVSALPMGTLMGVPAWTRDAVGVLTAEEAALIDQEPTVVARPVEADVDVASYVASRVGPAVVDRLVEPLLGGVYAGHAGRLSLQATIPVLWTAAHAGQSLVAAARAQGEQSRSAQPAEPVFAGIRGGVGRLPLAVRAAVESLGGRVLTGVTVRELRPQADPRGDAKADPAGLRWQVVTGSRADERVVEADAVVLAVPARPASRLLSLSSPAAAAALSHVEAASVALVTAVLPGAAGLVGPAGSGFLVPPVEGRLVKAVTYSSAKWAWLAERAGPDLVLRLSVGRQGDEAVLQRTDDELTGAVLAELSLALGAVLPTPSDTRVVRWGGGLPQYAVGHVDLVESVRGSVAEVGGLSICGAYLDGLGVPACIAAARAAAAQVLTDLPGPRRDAGPTMGR